jgi:hypothetical protein
MGGHNWRKLPASTTSRPSPKPPGCRIRQEKYRFSDEKRKLWGPMPPGVGASLPLAASHDQRYEHGLIHDEQRQKHKSWNYGSREQESHAGRH